jgi:dTDP-4-dehydrorhamnose reductase
MKIILIGYTGMLGADFYDVLQDSGHELWVFNSKNLDITDIGSIEKQFAKISNIDLIINCAAYTKVDDCEINKEEADKLNRLAPENLARYGHKRNITLVHFSTDYVFNGQKKAPYKEEDKCDPINYYGLSKLKGEQAIQKNCEAYYIFRIQWLYGEQGPNFIKQITKLARERDTLAVVADQKGAPTWTKEIVRCVMPILNEEKATYAYGIYHLAAEGYTTWFDYTKFLLDYLKIPCKITKQTSEEIKRLAKRPKNSCLCTDKYTKSFEQKPQVWQKAVKEYLEMSASFGNEKKKEKKI